MKNRRPGRGSGVEVDIKEYPESSSTTPATTPQDTPPLDFKPAAGPGEAA